MATTLDTLHVDLSLRNHQQVISGLATVKNAIAGIPKSLAISNLGEIKSLIGAGGISALIGAGTVKAAADLEQARLGLKRFVDTDFSGLSEGIDKLSYKIPIAVTGLYDIASGAAQVGVTGTKNILAFTEVVGKLATVSSMSFNETAKDLAKLHNVFGLGAGQAPRTANVIAGLSAASAADPGELITTTRYLSGASSTIKFTLDQTIALAAAIKDAGISSEVGGTAFNKLILDMAKMPEAFARITNMTTGDFKKLRDSNPMQALLKALKSIESEKTIDDKIAKSETIGVESVRQSGALLQLIKALELFEGHLERATKFGDERTELDKQFNTQAESTYSKLQKLGNAIMQVSDALGGGLSRAVGKTADVLTAMALSLKEPAKGHVGLGGGAPAQPGLNMGVAPPGAPGQFRPQGMGVPRGAPVVPPKPPEQKPGQKTPEQLADEARKAAEKLAKMDADIAAAKEKEKAAIEAENAAKTNLTKRQKALTTSIQDTHASTEQWGKTVNRAAYAAAVAENDVSNATFKRRIASEKVTELEMARAKMKDPFPKPVIVAAGNKEPPQPGAKVLEGGRKFAFDKMMDPAGFSQFEKAFASMPAKWKDSEAGKALAEKLKAAGGADVFKNMSEEELQQMIQKRAGIMGQFASEVAQEKTSRLFAKPQFRGADEAYKQYAAGGAEGDPATRIAREHTKLIEKTNTALADLTTKLEQGLLKIADGAIVFN